MIDQMPYLDMRDRHREEVREFFRERCFVARTPAEVEARTVNLRRRLDVPEGEGAVVSISPDIYCFEDDAADYEQLLSAQHDELAINMCDEAFAAGAFLTEMRRHNYLHNRRGDYVVCSRFGDCGEDDGLTAREYLRAMGYSEATAWAFLDAQQECWRQSERG